MILKALFARDSLEASMLFLQNSLHKHPSPLQKQHIELGGLHSNLSQLTPKSKLLV